MNRFSSQVTAFVGTLICLFLVGCGESENLVDAKFSSPSSLVVAGPENNRLFVANAGSGTLQVLRLQDDLADMTFEESELVYFPLEIPLGDQKGYPSHLVASKEGGYVLALDSANASIHLVDAATLKKTKGEGVFKLGSFLSEGAASGQVPATLIEGRRECGVAISGRNKNRNYLVLLRFPRIH